jgi:hypothetical protein
MCSASACALVVGSLFAFIACGGKVLIEQTPFGDDAGNGGAGLGGSAAVGGAIEGQPATCAASVGVPVLIRNDLEFAIFIGPDKDRCKATPLFQVRSALGQLLNAPSRGSTECRSEAVKLEAGKSICTSWAGLPDVGTSGTFLFSAHAGSAIDCMGTRATRCDCDADAAGTCSVQNALISGIFLTKGAVVELDAQRHNKVVTLAFSGCMPPWQPADCAGARCERAVTSIERRSASVFAREQ